MAEGLREQWSWSSWVGWFGIGSMSPLTSLSTSSSRLSSNACLNEFDIISHVHWCAEVILWNKFLSIRVDASWSFATFSNIISGSEAALPDRVLGVFVNVCWVAEWLGE
jgi:hypothetical protein